MWLHRGEHNFLLCTESSGGISDLSPNPVLDPQNGTKINKKNEKIVRPQFSLFKHRSHSKHASQM
jgi:hypothetical protein